MLLRNQISKLEKVNVNLKNKVEIENIKSRRTILIQDDKGLYESTENSTEISGGIYETLLTTPHPPPPIRTTTPPIPIRSSSPPLKVVKKAERYKSRKEILRRPTLPTRISSSQLSKFPKIRIKREHENIFKTVSRQQNKFVEVIEQKDLKIQSLERKIEENTKKIQELMEQVNKYEI